MLLFKMPKSPWNLYYNRFEQVSWYDDKTKSKQLSLTRVDKDYFGGNSKCFIFTMKYNIVAGGDGENLPRRKIYICAIAYKNLNFFI